MAVDPVLLAKVRDNIQAAKDGDYDMSGYTDEDLAGDLSAFASDLEKENYEDILAAVKELRHGSARQS
jgi:hypothetical protein